MITIQNLGEAKAEAEQGRSVFMVLNRDEDLREEITPEKFLDWLRREPSDVVTCVRAGVMERLNVYTVVYLPARRMPKGAWSKRVWAKDPDDVLFQFVNTPEHDEHFVACVVEGEARSVHKTQYDGSLVNPFSKKPREEED